MKTDYKYGILSTASIVPRFIAALRDSGCGEPYAIASRSIQKAAEKAGEWNIPKSYGSYEELLADKEIDVVYVAMINSEHYRYALMALEAGKHVLCEKPITLSSGQARYLFQTAKEKGLLLMEAQKAVFLPVMKALKSRIQEGKLGKIQFIDCTSSCSAVYNEWLHKVECGGGAMAGSASYSVHLAQYLVDEPVKGYSGLCTKNTSEVDEQCVVNINLGDKVLFVSKISTNVKAVDRMLIFGDRGWAEIAEYWKARKAVIHYTNGDTEELHYPCAHELVYEICHYHECLEKGLSESPVMSERMSVQSLEILDGIRKNW